MPDQLPGVFDSSRPVEIQLSSEMNVALGLAGNNGPIQVSSVILRDGGTLQVDHVVSGGKNRYLLDAGSYVYARQNFPDQSQPSAPQGG